MPHPGAQALRRQRSGILGFVPRASGDPYTDPVPHHLAAQLTRFVRHHGRHLVAPTEEDQKEWRSGEFIDLLLSLRVDGCVFFWPSSAKEIERFLEREIPVVQLLRVEPSVPTSTIVVDPAPGVAAAVEYLQHLGHQRIAFIGQGGTEPVDRGRLDAFSNTLAMGGCAASDDYIRLGSDYSVATGRAHMATLLALLHPPTAVFIAGDSLALGALHALHDAGVSVPDEMSVITYDGILADHLYPRLTHVAQPFAEVADHAVQMLTGQASHPADASPLVHLTLPTQLVVGASTSPPHDGRVRCVRHERSMPIPQ
jgi:LacI family transcriptional regulator